MKPIYIALALVSASLPAYAQEKSGENWGKNLITFTHGLPQVQAFKERLSAANYDRTAKSALLYNPTASFDVVSDDTTNFQVGINQTLDLFGKRQMRRKFGTAQARLAEQSFEVAYQDYLADVLVGLSEYEAARRQLVLAEKHASNLQALADLTKKRLANGDLGNADGTLATLALSSAYPTIAEERTKSIEAQARLKTLLGNSFADFTTLPNRVIWRDSGSIDTDSLLAGSPRVREAYERYQVARAAIGIAKKNRNADPTVGVVAGRDGGAALVGVNVSVPLNISKSFKASEQATSRRSLAAEMDYRQIQQAIGAELEGTLLAWRENTRQLDLYDNLTGAAPEEGLKILKARWEMGDMSTAEFLLALDRWRESVAAGIKLRALQRRSLVTWLRTSGQVKDWLGRH